MPFITANEHKLHYTDTPPSNDSGNSDAPALILIHGLGSSQNYYFPLLPQLAAYRCITLDTYGSARSRSQGEPLSLEGLCDDFFSLLDELKIQKVVGVGHSMGGTAVCRLAETQPDRVAGVVCIGPVNPKNVVPEMFTKRIDTVIKDGMEPLANIIPQAATNSKSTSTQRALIRELLLGQDPKSYASMCQVIVDMKEPRYDAIKQPLLIIAGEEDKSAPLEGCKYIHEHVGSQKKELKILNGVGHWHCIEAPEQVGGLIADFCSSL